MRNYLFLLAVLEEMGSLPKWAVVAVSPEHDRLRVQYEQTQGNRLLLGWELLKGVRIVRANLNGCQMSEDFTNIDMPLENIANAHRAGLYMPVYNAIREYVRS